MKVLHFYKSYFPESTGGIEQFIKEIALGASKSGIRTEVLTLSKEKNETIDFCGHKVHHCKINLEIASTPFSLTALSKFSQLANESDVIHYNFPYPFADLLHMMKKVRKPTVITYQSDIVRQKHLLKIYNPLKNLFLESVDRIVATSPNYIETSPDLRKLREKTTVIPIGLCKEDYPVPSDERVETWRKKFGSKFFLFIGVLRYYKGLHILIEAAARTNYPVVIIGKGPLEKELKDKVDQLGIKNVYFVGFVSDEDKVALLKLCYAIAFPSHLRSEAFGVTLVEGAMYGKPLISCEIGTGTSYINKDKETGLVIPPNDPVALKQAMDYLWENEQEAKDMGIKAEARFQKLFTRDQMIESYVQIYKSL